MGKLALLEGKIYFQFDKINIFRFLTDKFNLESMTTLGVDDQFQCVQLSDGSIIKLRVMDTAGQEKFNAISENYYKQADCCLLMYDITSMDSFERIKKYYIETIKTNCKRGIKIILLGNKTDLKDKRKVSQDDGKTLAEENGYMFMESSCKDNYNVSDAFTALIEMTSKEIARNNRSQSSISLETKGDTSNSGCCKNI